MPTDSPVSSNATNGNDGPPKLTGSFASRIVHHFGGLFSSCFIPVRNLPPRLDRDRRSGLDYFETSGCFDSKEFGVSDKQLLARRDPKETNSDQQTTEVSENIPNGANSDIASSEKDEISSISTHSDEGSKQFNMSYHKTSRGNIEDGLSGKTHIAQLHAVPGFTFNVDARPPYSNTRVCNHNSLNMVNHDLNTNEDLNGGISVRNDGGDLSKPIIDDPKRNDWVASRTHVPQKAPRETLSFLDVGVDAGSAAAVMKESTEQALARLKSAKESIEKIRENFQGRRKLGQREGTRYKEGEEDKSVQEVKVFSKAVTENTPVKSDKKKNEIISDEREKARIAAKVTPDREETEKPLESDEQHQQTFKGNECKLSHSYKLNEKSGACKTDAQFYGFVNNEKKFRLIKEVPDDIRAEKIPKMVNVTIKEDENERTSSESAYAFERNENSWDSMEEVKEPRRKFEKEKEREREREKDRLVKRTSSEAGERAFAEAQQSVERIFVKTVTQEVRQRALTESQEKASREAKLRAESAAVQRVMEEARQRALAECREKASREAKLRAESAAAEARVRDVERAGSENAAADAKKRAEKLDASSRDKMKKDNETKEHFRERDKGDGRSKDFPHDAQFQGEVESALRCKARLERHQLSSERAAKALSEKNMRDILYEREKTERNGLAEYVDANVRRWSSGQEGNLRALLFTLQYILGPESGWNPVSLTDVRTDAGVRNAYRKAILCVHPDKLQQRGANIKEKYLCEKVFDILKEAWNQLNSKVQ